MKLHIPKVIIFDWDNTLVDTWGLIHASIRKVFLEFDKEPLTLEEMKVTIHKSLKDAFPLIFGKCWEDAGKRFYHYYCNTPASAIKPLAGALELLTLLKGNGISLGIVSNKRGDILRKEVGHLGWTGYFDQILGSLDVCEDKPSPMPVLELLKLLKISDASDAWFVGDTIVDMECAKSAGCLPIFFGRSAKINEIQVESHAELSELYLSSQRAVSGSNLMNG